MTSTFSPLLRLDIQDLYTNANFWGNPPNANFEHLEDALAGLVTISVGGSDYTLTATTSVADEARNAVLFVVGAPASDLSIIIPDVSKIYTVYDGTTGAGAITVRTVTGSGYACTAGGNLVFCDGVSVWNGAPKALDAGPAVATGTMLPFAGTAAPTGWLMCQGQAVSRVVYADLFAAIATDYGAGDGSTTFNIPDLRENQLFGYDQLGGFPAANNLPEASFRGAASGTATTTLTLAQIPAHGHAAQMSPAPGGHQHLNNPFINNNSKVSNVPNVAGGYGEVLVSDNSIVGVPGYDFIGTVNGDGAHAHSVALQNGGGGAAHNNLNPFLVLNYIIKT